MNHIEAMKQALDALETGWTVVADLFRVDHVMQYEKAITALRTAIEQAEKQEPVAWKHTMLEDVVIGHRPADLNVHPDRWMPLYKDPTPCKTCEALARTVMMDQTAHDTPPAAQRQWVGLTNQELVYLTSIYSGAPLYCAIEAKLREKNGGQA